MEFFLSCPKAAIHVQCWREGFQINSHLQFIMGKKKINNLLLSRTEIEIEIFLTIFLCHNFMKFISYKYFGPN